MAIIFESDAGYFIDHNKFIQESCGRSIKEIFFNLRTPFLRDLEAAAEAKALEAGVPRVRKHKKQQPQPNSPIEESLALNLISQLSSFLKPLPLSTDYYTNNKPTREAVNAFLSSSSGAKFEDVQIKLSDGNDMDIPVEKQYYEETFILPANSKFYKHDISQLKILGNQTFPLIVIDPPWTNRFIKRKRKFDDSKGYHSMEDFELASLPIKEFCREATLVAVWCTNSPTHLTHLRNVLLPAWNLKQVATWYWVKITTSGQFICRWSEPNGKHPYEPIIIARRESANDTNYPAIPDKKLVISVPCAFHSSKPPLTRVLKPFLQNDDGPYLELFARSLVPNTISWGNQVPLLQHISLFEKTQLLQLAQSQ